MNPFRRKTNVIVVSAWLAAALVIGVVGFYFFQFHDGLANTSEEWANFGSYIGGALGSVFAFMAFALGLHTLNQARQQSRRDELLKSIQGYERDFELCISKPVTCESPWIWGNDLNAATTIPDNGVRFSYCNRARFT